ncbi:hypothetical protein [Azospirillum sp. TSO22-1]|uniref:hypothetical protein n=1 Tax=Azospirillum sp. TSO22-1 TaxID=716789 RepID=UPI0011B6C582|nr:hypothetical protein [Azospirillum sp. TSO22-1]
MADAGAALAPPAFVCAGRPGPKRVGGGGTVEAAVVVAAFGWIGRAVPKHVGGGGGAAPILAEPGGAGVAPFAWAEAAGPKRVAGGGTATLAGFA